MADAATRAQELLERLASRARDGESSVITSISADFEDGTSVAVRGARRPEAAGHDADELAAVVAAPDAEPAEMAEVLLSTEYGRDGTPRRIGLELYEDAEAVPRRIAADREGEAVVTSDGGRRTVSKMTFRLEGTRGAGVHEVVAPE